MVRHGKGLHKYELKAVSLALKTLKDQCQNQAVLVAMDNSTVEAYINKQGGTHSAKMCALLWKIMTWCCRCQITLRARHIPGGLNVVADLLSRSNQVQSAASAGVQTDLSKVVRSSCRFATHMNHKLHCTYLKSQTKMLGTWVL